MGKKIALCAIVVGGVILAYIFLTAVISLFVDVASTANLSHGDWSMYPGSQAMLIGAPWYIYFIPAIVGMGAIIFILKEDIARLRR